MRLRCLLPVFITMLVLGGCGVSVSDVLHNTSREATIIPALRYVKYDDDRARYEDISEGNPEIADEIINTPVALGAMKVDCQSMTEIGILIYRGDSWRHDFDFVVSWPEGVDQIPDHFAYENWLRSGYLKGAARFREPLSNGVMTMSVTHRREKIYSTDFEVVNCPDSIPLGET